MGILRDAQVKNLKEPKRYKDGGGLFLLVTKSGTKSWMFRYSIAECEGGIKRQREMTFGKYPAVKIADARKKAAEAALLVEQGIDPQEKKKEQVTDESKVPTFREAATAEHPVITAGWRNEKDRKTWLQRLERHAFPVIGDLPVDKVTTDHIIETLRPVWNQNKETSRKLRQGIRKVFRRRSVKKYVKQNPFDNDEINEELGKLKLKRKHHPTIHHSELPELMRAIDECQSSRMVKLLFYFILNTAVRGHMARRAVWDELDLERRIWIIPSARMKVDTDGEGWEEDFRVPLSEQVVDILEEARSLNNGSDYIFPAPHGGEYSDQFPMQLIHEVGYTGKQDIHGLRGMFSTWCAETGKPRDITEVSLAHKFRGETEDSYSHSDLLERRRPLMDEWSLVVNS